MLTKVGAPVQIPVAKNAPGRRACSKASPKFGRRQVGEVSVLDVAGRITLGRTSSAFRDALGELTEASAKKIVLNLRDVSYIDSSGIGELVAAYKKITERGGQLKLSGLSGQGAYQLLVTKSCSFFETYVDDDAAIHSFDMRAACALVTTPTKLRKLP